MQRIHTLIESHLKWFLGAAPMLGYGPLDAPVWMSSLDLRSGRAMPPDRPDGIEKRCYRFIESPLGSNLYWDLPLMAFCFQYSEVTGQAVFREAAERYVNEYLQLATAENGLFFWGNHYYIEAARGKVVWFIGNELIDRPPSAAYHETRPLRVPWALFRNGASAAASRSIRAQAASHIVDPSTGEFNRHSDGKAEHPFLEAGGVLVESLCSGGNEFDDPSLIDLAERIARFSFEARDAQTGLLPVSPRRDRWDKFTATSEVGQWAGCLLQAARITGRDRFSTYAKEALSAWLRHAWSESDGQFFGRLNCKTGLPDRSAKTTVYQPGEFSDCWEPLFPGHDYPFVAAQTCLDLYNLDQDPVFQLGVERWLKHLARQMPARAGRGGYAEHYGRALHFLISAREAGFGEKVDPPDRSHRSRDRELFADRELASFASRRRSLRFGGRNGLSFVGPAGNGFGSPHAKRVRSVLRCGQG